MQASAEQAQPLESETQVVLISLSQLDNSLHGVQIAVASNEQAGTTQEVSQHMQRLHDMIRANRQYEAHRELASGGPSVIGMINEGQHQGGDGRFPDYFGITTQSNRLTICTPQVPQNKG